MRLHCKILAAAIIWRTAVASAGANYYIQSDSGTLNLGNAHASQHLGRRLHVDFSARPICSSRRDHQWLGGGTVSVAKSGAGTLTLNNTNTYTGGAGLAQGLIQSELQSRSLRLDHRQSSTNTARDRAGGWRHGDEQHCGQHGQPGRGVWIFERWRHAP